MILLLEVYKCLSEEYANVTKAYLINIFFNFSCQFIDSTSRSVDQWNFVDS